MSNAFIHRTGADRLSLYVRTAKINAVFELADYDLEDFTVTVDAKIDGMDRTASYVRLYILDRHGREHELVVTNNELRMFQREIDDFYHVFDDDDNNS